MVDCKRKDCVFRKLLSTGNTHLYVCHYSLDTNELRGCSASECDKYIPKTRKKLKSDKNEVK